MTSPYPFAAGATLTAAQLNSYAGLVFVKSVAIGSGVSSVSVTDAFSTDHTNYRILITTWTSGNVSLRLSLSGATGATDYGSETQYFTVYASGGFTNGSFQSADAWAVGYSTSAVSTAHNGVAIDIFRPKIAGRQRFVSTFSSYVSGIAAGQTASSSSNGSTGFTFKPTSGTLGGGNIEVYGYNDD